ncbi:MAG: glycosyltransferase [Desulfobacterales bacterium]|nr:glycosyltransferase [Desulfobacterales bacterium]
MANILILTEWYPTEANKDWGIFVREFAHASKKFDNIAVLFSSQDPLMKGLFKISDNMEDGIRVIRIVCRQIPFSRCLNIILLFIVFLRLKREIPPDLIHVHEYSSGILACVAKALFKIPYAVTQHYAITKEDFKIVYRHESRLKSSVRILLAKIVFHNASHIISVSRYMMYEIEKLKIKNSFSIVPNTVDTFLFYPQEDLKQPEPIKHILFVGDPTYRKGIDTLLEAISMVRKKRNDFVLHILGDGYERKHFEHLTEKRRLTDLVTFHGYKTKMEVADFMRKSDFLVLPSIWECLPCVIIEALSCGLPIAASNVGGVKEMVNQDRGVLVLPKNAADLADAIMWMLDNYQNYDTNAIYEYSLKNFGHEIIGRKLHQIYRYIIRKDSRH